MKGRTAVLAASAALIAGTAALAFGTDTGNDPTPGQLNSAWEQVMTDSEDLAVQAQIAAQPGASTHDRQLYVSLAARCRADVAAYNHLAAQPGALPWAVAPTPVNPDLYCTNRR